MFFTLFLSSVGISAMDYGDMPQSTSVPITSWVYNKVIGKNKVQVCQAVVKESAVTTMPASSNIPKTAALAIAGTALTWWAVKKIVTEKLYKNKMALCCAGGVLSLCTAWMYFKSKNGE